MTDDAKDISNIFKAHQLIPDVISVPPAEFLKVIYPSGVIVDKGNKLTPTQVKETPSVEWTHESNQFYTLTFTDPDAPSRKNPQFREYQHWIVANIPGNDLSKGEILTAYVGSGPPQEIHIPKNSGKNRAKFCVMKFAKKYKLGEPLAGNFYQAEWDDYVPTVHRQLSG
ncbi:phosphatidylethanolamine-binding protein homolog F40A3.3-like isoform X2 [Lucilia cuprina]|uniref:phosphatidylethanolamine-binding protein homolog F40A3.3-like isoform X2 n=1 Tax=Lucilia cuprina TaxID=7375 RepID=UPI001F059096|nr:phosphatidylethanolamine-binding protein homolog F40A3.3-like isoform X2 [Lucilia cuprina]